MDLFLFYRKTMGYFFLQRCYHLILELNNIAIHWLSAKLSCSKQLAWWRCEYNSIILTFS